MLIRRDMWIRWRVRSRVLCNERQAGHADARQCLEARANRSAASGRALGTSRSIWRISATIKSSGHTGELYCGPDVFVVSRITMLFDAFSARSLTLTNRIVMAPMTRSRAVEAQLSAARLLYVHLVDHSAMGAPPVPAEFKL